MRLKMPYKIEITKAYTKKVIKFLKKHQEVTVKYKKIIFLLEANPFHPSLRLHKLTGKLDEIYSVSIDMQYRITIEFYIENEIIIPINIGTHNDVYR